MNDCLMQHSIGANTKTNAQGFAHNTIQGHHHSEFGVIHYADKSMIRWTMSVGCLLDPNSPAARYGKSNAKKRPILGCGVILSEKKGNYLVIPDTHMPYHHKDSFDFLWDVACAYDTQNYLHVGDLIDHHASSYHESEPDAYYPEQEKELAQENAQYLQEMFPDMDISEGNHDVIPKRKAKSMGLPTSMLSDMNKIYDLENTWRWHDEYFFDCGGGQPHVVPMVMNKRGRWNKKVA